MSITYTENYQLFYLKKALQEANITNFDISINHKVGINYINGVKYPLTFPLYLRDYISNLSKAKSIDYNFIGTITEKRKWIQKYNKNSLIKNSNKGRTTQKYQIDKEYYDILCKSKFTLTPTGDCPWSYRFFEAILCFSIPILENNSDDIYCNDYFFYYDNDTHIYDVDKVLFNYNKLVRSNHFLNNIDSFCQK